MGTIAARMPMMAKRAFSLSIVAYVVSSLALGVFAYRVFGMWPAVGLSLMLCLPPAVSLRMLSRWYVQSARDCSLLLVLLVVDLLGVGFVVQNWYDTGMDKRHVQEMKNYEFIHMLGEDSAFHDVQGSVRGKGIVWLNGKVASHTDLDRLNSIAEQRQISAMVNVEVTSRR
ncbi:MAG TPA: hypothetical protein VGG64_12230 [Pirellulales bacterium]